MKYDNVYLLRVDTMVTAKSISCAYNDPCVGVVKLASIAAMLVVLLIVSFRSLAFRNKERFSAYKTQYHIISYSCWSANEKNHLIF